VTEVEICTCWWLHHNQAHTTTHKTPQAAHRYPIVWFHLFGAAAAVCCGRRLNLFHSLLSLHTLRTLSAFTCLVVISCRSGDMCIQARMVPASGRIPPLSREQFLEASRTVWEARMLARLIGRLWAWVLAARLTPLARGRARLRRARVCWQETALSPDGPLRHLLRAVPANPSVLICLADRQVEPCKMLLFEAHCHFLCRRDGSSQP
jgi:hypothetical protein